MPLPGPPPAKRRRLALALLLLLVLAAPGDAAAQATPPTAPNRFAVTSVAFEDETLTVRIAAAGSPTFLEMASLTRDGVKLASDVPIHRWVHLDEQEIVFRLARATDLATLTLVHQDGDQKRGQETHLLSRPPQEEEDEPSARVDALDAGRLAADLAYVVLANVGDAPARDLRVSVLDPSGAYAATPFVRHVDRLDPGAEANFTFRFTWSGNPYTLLLEHDNETRTLRVHVPAWEEPDEEEDDEEDATKVALNLTTDFPSREAEPGGAPAYALRLENDGSDALVTLRATGLPEAFSTSFLVQGSRASSFRIPEGSARDVTLGLNVPASATALVGQEVSFLAEVLVDGEVVAAAPLVLVVRGAGRLEVSGENWFTDASPGAPARVQVTLANTGTAPLYDVTPLATIPTGWRVAFDPPAIERLQPGASTSVTLTLTPPDDVGQGRYVLDVAAASGDVSARARSLTVGVAGSGSSALPWIGAAAVAAVATVGMIVKLRRR